jgi:hypothetical protein
MIQQYLFQQIHNLTFVQNKLGLHISAYQAIIRAPVTKNTEITVSQSLLSALQHNTGHKKQEETLLSFHF